MAQPPASARSSRSRPAFRADPSFTCRHATEFTSVDAEISWIDSPRRRHGDARGAARRRASRAVKDKHGAEIKELFGVEVTVPTAPVPAHPAGRGASEIVAERGYEVPRTDDDMDPEGERQISAYVEGGARARVRVPHRLRRRASARSTTCATTTTRAHQQLRPASSTASRSPPAPSASTASTCSMEQAKEKGLDPERARLLPRLLPLRRSAARRIRHGPVARAHADAAPAESAR